MSAVSPDIFEAPRIPQRVGGPVTAAKLRRTAAVYGLLCIIGMLPVVLGSSPALQALGLGLWLPGGGFLAVGGWVTLLFPVTVALFVLSVVAWFWAGMVVAPTIVWLGSAVLAGALAGPSAWPLAPYLVPIFAFTTVAWYGVKKRRRRLANLESFKVRESYLPEAMAEVARRSANVAAPGSRELTPEQLAASRGLYDRALQPVSEFKWFDNIDQFQPAAFRYQINHAAFGLGIIQCNYAPSFRGYLRRAQENLIHKYILRRVWGYWVYESMWGHFNFSNFDPAGKDNIMLTGWFGMQLGQYALNTGDMQFSSPGSLPFRLNDKTVYQHDHHTVVNSVVKNFKRSDFTLYPCEPNWVYPICNFYGMSALASHDAVYGTKLVPELLPQWLEKLDSEFTQESGTMIGLRSYWTGIEMPFYTGEPGFAFFANVFAPKRAQRMWAIARTELSTCLTKDANGQTRLTLPKLQGIDAIDPGYYKPGLVFAYGGVMMCAREFGDDELAEAAERSLEQDCGPVMENGVKRYRKGSWHANIWAIEGKLMRTGDFRRLFVEGPPKSVFTGPILAEAVYPEVLVAKAFSHGDDLELVLYPGEGACHSPIRIERLKPGATYQVEGNWEHGPVIADSKGAADLTVSVAGRTFLRFVPA